MQTINNLFTNKIFKITFLNNSLQQYIIAFIIFVLAVIIFKIFQVIFLKRFEKLAQKTKTTIDDVFVKIIKNIKPPFYFFLAFWTAIQWLVLSDLANKIINTLLIIWITSLIIKSIQILINYIAEQRIKKNKQAKTIIQLLSQFTKITLWLLGLLMILANLGVNITSLIAGLGIGGIAVALALQNILGDLFSSFAIFLDKPFQTGDYIVIGTDAGTVKKIGIKTTRLISRQGEELVIPNKELTSARINNFQDMPERRIVFQLGLEYSTSTTKLKKALAIITEIIKKITIARLDRIHFKSFGDSALIIEIVYFVKSQDYAIYLDTQEKINFQIKEKFEQEKINFAFPSQTIYLQK